MDDELYKIRKFLTGVAEAGAAQLQKDLDPKSDRLTQRQAFSFFKARDTQFGGEFTHGEAWVRAMTKAGHLHPVRIGKAANSPIYWKIQPILPPLVQFKLTPFIQSKLIPFVHLKLRPSNR